MLNQFCPRSVDTKCASFAGTPRALAQPSGIIRLAGRSLHSKAGKDDRLGLPAKDSGNQQQQHTEADVAPAKATTDHESNVSKAADGTPSQQSATQVLQSAVKPSAGSAGWRPDARVMFAIPPAKLSTPMTEVLHCPTMRDILGDPRPSTLRDVLAGIWEGKYVSDEDRVALNVMDFASPASTGAHALCFDLQQQLQQQWDTKGDAKQQTPSEDSSSSGSAHLALNSGIYGSFTDNNYASFSSMASMDSPAGSQVCLPLPPFAMRAGPRDHIYLDPETITAAIITTGNICPGMNDVIESMVKRLHDYGVPEDNVLGIKYGIRGFNAKDAKPVVLTRKTIDGIHLTGGTILGTSNVHRMHRHHHRHHHMQPPSANGNSSGSGSASTVSDTDDDEAARAAEAAAAAAAANDGQDAQLEAILDKLDFWRINILCVIGGQGGNQLVAQLAAGCQRRGIPCCVTGVPKSIDNDVMLMDKTFGFDTVVQEVVQRPLQAAKVEAASARKGVGLVKVFGRRSGFIALQASLASGAVDVCLIPEEPFELEGPQGVLQYIQQLVEKQGHAVICVAEGAGQDILYPGGEEPPVDESGNPVLRDIGTALKKAIKGAIPDADVKYIDPTYMVQAVPCNSQDHIYCRVLGFHAVDAAMAGYTGVTVGQVNGHFVLLPSSVITMSARRVDPKGKSWNRLRASIGQPRFQNNSPTDMPVHAVAAAQPTTASADRKLPGTS